MARHAEVDEKTGMAETDFEETPPVIELVDKAHPEKVVAWACGKCRVVCPDERLAREHCQPNICECGASCKKYHTACDKCIEEKRARKALQEREAAEVVSADTYDGPVFWQEEDRYYPNAEEAFEAVADDVFHDEACKAQTLWTCDILKFRLDAGDIIDQELTRGEHHEDAAAMISGAATTVLQKLLDDWVEEHANDVESWFPSEKIRIEFPESGGEEKYQ